MQFEQRDANADGTRFTARGGRDRIDVFDGGFRLALDASGPGLGPIDDAPGEALEFTFEGTAAPFRAIAPAAAVPAGRVNYLNRAPDGWRTDVELWTSVRLQSGDGAFEVVLRARDGGTLEYDVVAAPGARIEDLAVRVRGGSSLHVDDGGRLVVATTRGPVAQDLPAVWDEDATGNRRPLNARFAVLGADRFGFRVDGRDPARTLVVDPGLVFLRVFGGSANDHVTEVATTAAGKIVVVGYTASSTFSLPATPGACATPTSPPGQRDIYLARFSAAGVLEYLTFFGSATSDEFADSLVLQTPDIAIVVGASDAYGFGGPSPLPCVPCFGACGAGSGHNALMIRLNMAATGAAQFLGGVLIGGNGFDEAADVVIDGSGNIVVGGFTDRPTAGADFPTTPGSFQPARPSGGTRDGFVVRLSPTLSILMSSTFVGGDGEDQLVDLATGFGSAITFAGLAGSPTTGLGGFGSTQTVGPLGGLSNGFVARLDATLSTMTYSAFVGGSAADTLHAVADSPGGAVTVGGSTYSSNFLVSNAPTSTAGGASDGVLLRLSAPNGGPYSVVFSYRFGGATNDSVNNLVVDPSGTVTFVGYCSAFAVGPNPPPTGPAGAPWQPSHLGNSNAAYVARGAVAAGQWSLSYWSYLGGEVQEDAIAVALHPSGDVIVGGSTMSASFPDGNPAPPSVGIATQGGWDAYVLRLRMSPTHAGAANGPDARLEINGQPTAGLAGPFCVDLSGFTTLTTDWSGPANGVVILAAAPFVTNAGVLLTCVPESFDLPPGALFFVFGAPPPPGVPFFTLPASGMLSISFSQSFPPGLSFGLQGAVLDPATGCVGLAAAYLVTT